MTGPACVQCDSTESHYLHGPSIVRCEVQPCAACGDLVCADCIANDEHDCEPTDDEAAEINLERARARWAEAAYLHSKILDYVSGRIERSELLRISAAEIEQYDREIDRYTRRLGPLRSMPSQS